MRLRIWKSLIPLAGISLVLAGCGGTAATSTNSKPVTVGISLALTGDYSGIGQGELQGYRLWQSYINSHGGLLGRKVQLLVADDASDPNTAVSNYQDFITKDHATLLFGPPTTLIGAPAGLVAKRYGYAFPNAASGAPLILQEKLHNFFLMQPAGPLNTGVSWVHYILSLPKSQRPKTVAYVALQDPFLTPATQLVKKALSAAGIKSVYYQVYGTEDQEMEPIVAAMAATHAQMVIAGSQEFDCFNIVKAMVAEHYNPKFLFFMNGPGYPVLFPKNVGANNVNGIFTALGWYPQERTTGQKTFETEYLKKYGGSLASISPDAVEAYTVGQVMAEAIDKTHSLNNAKIIAALHHGTWPSLQGPLHFGASGVPDNGLLLMEWIHGKLTAVYPSRVAVHAPAIPKANWGG
ncbi:MAG: ABC transporter substrate-binding protein [Candidatus Dormibacteria bacterium]